MAARARTRRRAAAVVAVVVVGVSALSCSTGSGAQGPASSQASAPVPTSSAELPAAPGVSQRGEIIDSSPLRVDAGGVLADASMTRVVYRSTAGYSPGDPDGTFGTRVSGFVAVPPGPAPAGGWPVVALGHGTTGTAADCGPSGHADLLGETSTVAALLSAGYVVAASDYQGLGEHQVPHPYLDTETIAYNMIDMVRAARFVVPQAGTRWAALGSSQGGQAAWASAEYANSYGAGLDFVGAAALAPAADISPIAEGADATPYVAPTFTQIQIAFIPLIVDGLRAVFPDFPVGDYMRGGLAAGAEALTSCGSGSELAKYSAITQIRPGDAAITSPTALRRLHDILAADALPLRRADGPLFVAYGSADQIITPEWTTAAVARACALGDTISSTIEPGKGHTNLTSRPRAIAWIGERFADQPAPNTCPLG